MKKTKHIIKNRFWKMLPIYEIKLLDLIIDTMDQQVKCLLNWIQHTWMS